MPALSNNNFTSNRALNSSTGGSRNLDNASNGLNGSAVNGAHAAPDHEAFDTSGTTQVDVMPSIKFKQEPIAVVGFACRLPDNCHTPRALWNFLESGRIAKNTPPKSRYDIKTHYDGSLKNKTMASPGGMFLQDVDPADLDAQFFKLSRVEALAMDPQQRQLLEVVYEGLENAGITLEQLDQASVGCFVASFAGDYADAQNRDPEDRAAATVVGTGRAMLSNRISHFLNIKGPSMTIDTACSGSLTGLDVACRYLHNGEIDGAIIGGCNIYLSPEWVMDHHMGANGTASLSGKCHTFDEKADGYIKAEAVNMVYLKRLDDAVRDCDPIRGIIRGSATNSDGWTAGIASPNSEAQAQAIRQAYANAGISDLSATSYVECHGTGTRAGDGIEVKGISSVFGPFRDTNSPLRIGSIKTNVGHSEPGAGISGLLKTILSLEAGMIPGNPTFVDPNPNINFEELKLLPCRRTTKWPVMPFRRASVNSFGYGGSNAHVIVDEAGSMKNYASSYAAGESNLFEDDEDETGRPLLLAFSANDEQSLKAQYLAFDKHLSDLNVQLQLRDMAYTLSEKRSRHYHRGFTIASTINSIDMQSFTNGTVHPEQPRIGFIFTGQGAQWSEMGKDLLMNFAVAADHVRYLDEVLLSIKDPPSWSLFHELTKPKAAEHLKLPEISQPICTAFQLAILAVMEIAGVKVEAVTGHSSGEIAAAVAAGLLTPAQAIKIAYFRGQATAKAVHSLPVGTLAVGIGSDTILHYLEGTSVQIACYNSPSSLTLSGTREELGVVETRLKGDNHFSRFLQVDAAYHSRHMTSVADIYQDLLDRYVEWPEIPSKGIIMFSSTTGKAYTRAPDPSYWVQNMVSPVLFNQSVSTMLSRPEGLDVLVEIGPSNALSGPVKQIKATLSKTVEYIPAWKRGSAAFQSLLELAGKLFIMGSPIKLAEFNRDQEETKPSFIVDLPNYSWNHSTKFWYESDASVEWRFRKFVHHDLLGGKILGTPWKKPSWRKVLLLNDSPWLRDHRLGDSVIFPASGYIAMAIEAIFQKNKAIGRISDDTSVHQVTYKLRDVTFSRAMPLEDQDKGTKIIFTLTPCAGTEESWHEFVVSSAAKDIVLEHCRGRVRVAEESREVGTKVELAPFRHGTTATIWYKAMKDAGYSFGPGFQRLLEVEVTAGLRQNRARVTFDEPEAKARQSTYPIHPSTIDSMFQAGSPSLWSGHRSSVGSLLVPAMIDELTIRAQSARPEKGVAVANAEHIGVGRLDDAKRYKSNVTVYNEQNEDLLFRLNGLRYHAVDADNKTHSHPYNRVTWNPDASLMSKEHLDSILNDEVSTVSGLCKLIDLIAYKDPYMRIRETNLVGADSFWIDQIQPLVSEVTAECEYLFSTSSPEVDLESRTKYAGSGAAQFTVHDPKDPFVDIGPDDTSKVLILSIPESEAALQHAVEQTRRAIAEDGLLVVLQAKTDSCSFPGFAKLSMREKSKQSIDRFQVIYVGRRSDIAAPEEPLYKNVHLVRFGSHIATKDIAQVLQDRHGWKIEDHQSLDDDVPNGSMVLVLDEIFAPIVSNITDRQYKALQRLIENRCKLLWVSAGAHMSVSFPERGLFVGVARSLCSEDPEAMVMCLDIESSMNNGSIAAIHSVLKNLADATDLEVQDSEFVERDGLIHISRMLPDHLIGKSEKAALQGPEPQLLPFHNHPSNIHLVSNRIGTIDGLQWGETREREQLPDNKVEVDIHAAALNFKDLANVMGFVPANEHEIGLEAAGIVTRVGKGINEYKIGDRVVISRREGGCFANRTHQIIEGLQPIPDWISFELESDVAIGCCLHDNLFATAVYGLIDLANAQKGETVLIHAAAGGVGLATIQLARYLGLQIYVTAGSETKQKFLQETCDIREDCIFTSRSVTFAPQLLAVTNGRGVDIILNATTGDMLHESWRCIAENGRFLEIGKKDMLDRNSLSMEPFTRNASYRAFDLSHNCITDKTRHRLLSTTMRLAREGHIQPLHICKTFSFDNIVEAFRYVRDGKQIGKVVITDFGHREAVQVPITPLVHRLQLKADGSYMISGGLKGLCGSLAIYLARQGAKNLVILSRSGYDDAVSQGVLYHLKALGTTVDLIRGDVTKEDDVRRAFTLASKPILGVIQGAMVLRDKLFPSMSAQEFRDPIDPKVRGTWNLHNVSLEQNQPLEFFTLLSSISGVVGHSAQTNYSAGNVFQDSFAVHRKSMGLPACAVNLGLIEDVGYFTEREEFSRRLESKGWPPINEALLHRILCLSILQQTNPINPESAEQLITGISFPLTTSSPVKPHHRFSTLRAGTGASGGANEGFSHLAVLRNAQKKPDEVEYATVMASAVDVVNGVLMRSLGASEPLEPSRPLDSYGLDSLVAVELRNWVRSELSVEITALEVVGAKTLVALCEVIVKKILN